MVVEGMTVPHSNGQWVRYIDEIWRRDYELRDKTWRLIKNEVLKTLAATKMWREGTARMGTPLSLLREDHCFANEPCVRAACQALKVNIHMVNSRSEQPVTAFSPIETAQQRVANSRNPLVLVNWEASHYGYTSSLGLPLSRSLLCSPTRFCSSLVTDPVLRVLPDRLSTHAIEKFNW